MTSRDVADSVGHRQHCQTKCQRYTKQPKCPRSEKQRPGPRCHTHPVWVSAVAMNKLEAIKLILTVVSGICWIVVYFNGVRLGFRHRSYAIPFYALALNINWESRFLI